MKVTTAIILSVIFISSAETGYQVGDTVKDFTLKGTDGNMVSLSDFKTSKGVILIFDCNTCPYSQAYNKRIIGLNEVYGPKGFPVVAVNSNDPGMSPGDSFDDMVRYAKEKKYTFPYLMDESQVVGHAFGATNTPHVFLLKQLNGSFQLVYMGAIDDNPRNADQADKKYVEDAIAAILENKEVAVKKTRAIGCSIKYRK